MTLQFHFEPVDTLPTLSWCARVRRDGTVVVRHGKGVETRANGFVEGAWDGDFERFDFDQAQNLAGSGAVLRDGAVVFAACFHPLEHLHVIQGEETLVSNSLVFVLEESGEQLDPGYPNYTFDCVRTVRRGIARQPAVLRTSSDRKVELYTTCRLHIDASLKLNCLPAPLSPPPGSYGEYHDSLHNAVSGIVANAADSARRKTYAPVTACSRGYDSTAVSALASRVGCRRGLTFTQGGRHKGHPIFGGGRPLENDSGKEALTALGLDVSEFDRLKVLELSGHPRAEFFYTLTAGTDYCQRVMEDMLRDSVFFGGRHGERYWGPTRRCRRLNFQEWDDVNLSGRTYIEFRLRVGYIHLPVPYIGALHGPAIHRITHLEEMRPWRLNSGYYDRPIPRRMAEEAGVPRECFGHIKFGGVDQVLGLSQDSDVDLKQFVQDRVPAVVRRHLSEEPLEHRKPNHVRIKYLRTHYSHLPLASRAMEILGGDRLHVLWGSIYLYVFHWGVDKIRSRYQYQ